tara:strand:+ start:59662 stop:60588 length:927 start_codon:yes stop_codon:yes gene_type:complete
MAIRVPRGFEVSRPYYNELCEGVRPVAGATAKEAWTGLAHTRIDEQHHDPIVLEPGTLVGMVTGGNAIAAGKMTPAVMGTGAADAGNLVQYGASNTWTLPAASGDAAVGRVKPIGVCYQPVYSFVLEALYTNYKRNSAVGVVTDYVIQVPAVNSDEWDIEPGDTIMLGAGKRHGVGFMPPTPLFETHAVGTHLAGRYAATKNYAAAPYALEYGGSDETDRTVGRCLKKVYLGYLAGGAADVGKVLADNLATFTISAEATTEYANLEKIQTVPGLPLTGSGTKGIPGFWLGAKADAAGDLWGLTLLIRL